MNISAFSASQQRACTSTISNLDSSSFQHQFQYKKSYTMGENAPISRVKVKAFAFKPPGGATVRNALAPWRRAAGHRAAPQPRRLSGRVAPPLHRPLLSCRHQSKTRVGVAY